MNWSFLITFFGGIGLYLMFLIVTALIKRHQNKKKIKEEDKQREIEKDKERKEESNNVSKD